MKKTVVAYLILTLAVAAASTSCLREIAPVAPGSNPELSVRPSIFNDGAPTKAKEDTDPGIVSGDDVAARDELRENFFGSLDIFVKRQSDAPGTAWFKEYHLNAGDAGVVVDPDKYDSESLLDKAKQALASNWAEQGYVPDVPYDIYVTANNPHTAAGSAPANLTALQALSTNSTDIYRYYLTYTPSQEDRVYWTNCMYSEKKNFLMDGKIEGWTIDPSKAEQVFDVDLKRAAAKILLTVNFSSDKTLEMVEEPSASNPNPTPQTDAQGRVLYGSVKEYMQLVGRTAGEPRIKPVNFNLNAADIAYDADLIPSTGSLLTIDSNFSTFKEGDSSDNTDNTFAFVTYTYPVDWSSDRSRIPYLLLSVFYTRTDGDQLRSYYRIPVCDESKVTSLERNNIYIVDVEIASLGASNESLDAQDEELRIEYHVIPWTETNMSQEATTVKITDTKYLTIIPTEYTLKGDETQSVDLQWYASVSTDDGRIVDIDESTLKVTYVNYLGNTTDITGTVNKTGTMDGKHDIVITSTAPSSGTAEGEKVTLTLSPGGILRIDSEALKSRAVKDITFTVYLRNATGVDRVPITIRHFPLDNIQSFTGSWSSKWNGSTTTQSKTEYTFDLSVAQGWSGGYTTGEVEVSSSDPYDRVEKTYNGTPQNNSGDDEEEITASQFRTGIPTNGNGSTPRNSNRRDANSKANARQGSDGYYYWGTDPTTTGASSSNYDYRPSSGSGTYYIYRHYYRTRYYTLKYYRTRYSHSISYQVPSTGNWVDWDYNTGNTNYDGTGFYAKVYANGQANRINTDATTYYASNYSNLTNRQMYVIQLTATSTEYAIGRPVLDSNYQSQDQVCSPAFMIASQLGATSSGAYTAQTAAMHCGTYMEVDTDGYRFTGWRLPTKAEINTIIKYQTSGSSSYQVTMVRVLAGRYYWALDGNYYEAYSSGTDNTFVRCVRDLSLDEVNRLNRTNN